MLPISHLNPVISYSVDLTTKPFDLSLPADQPPAPRTLANLRVVCYSGRVKYQIWLTLLPQGQKLVGIVERIMPDLLWVSVTCILKGRVFLLDVSTNIGDLADLTGLTYSNISHFYPFLIILIREIQTWHCGYMLCQKSGR